MKEIALIFIFLLPLIWSVKEYLDRLRQMNPIQNSWLTRYPEIPFFIWLSGAVFVLRWFL